MTLGKHRNNATCQKAREIHESLRKQVIASIAAAANFVSTHITEAEEMYLGVGEDETDDWRKSNLIPDSNEIK